MSRLIASFLFVGYLRPMSGTWGSAAAVTVGLILHGIGSFPLLAVATVAAMGWGFWACDHYLADRPGADPSEVVIDEVAGQWIAMLFPSFAFWWIGLDNWNFPYPGWLAAFLFFRLFDIWKPGVIGRADARGDAAGVMLDDLWAGLFAGVATVIAAAVAHLFLL